MVGAIRSDSEVRISFAAILRIGQDDRYVLFHSENRPGSFGPPGGVFKYLEPATILLEGLGFRPDRIDSLADRMRCDLRGFMPTRSLRGFLSWFMSGAYRENATECLHRELKEELVEVGLPDLAAGLRRLSFRHVRTVMSGPSEVPGHPFRQLRRFEVYDLLPADNVAASLRRQLLDAGADGAIGTVLCATTAEIEHGRCGSALVAGHSAYLIGSTRTRQDLPWVR
jgi:hypothetical protein